MAGPASRTHAFSAGPSFLECGLRKWHAVEHETREYLAVLSEESLAQPVCYFSHMGDGFTYELWRPMLHLINRQSCYHRGQVATLLRQLGLQPPTVDFLPGYRAGFSRL